MSILYSYYIMYLYSIVRLFKSIIFIEKMIWINKILMDTVEYSSTILKMFLSSHQFFRAL